MLNIVTGTGTRRRRIADDDWLDTDEPARQTTTHNNSETTTESRGSTATNDNSGNDPNNEPSQPQVDTRKLATSAPNGDFPVNSAKSVSDINSRRDASRRNYLRYRQEQKLNELQAQLDQFDQSRLSDPKISRDYQQKLKIVQTIKAALAASETTEEYNMLDDDIGRKRKYDLLHLKLEYEDGESKASHTNKKKYDNVWEQEQLNKANQISKIDTDKINLPDLDKYSFVFDQSQFITYEQDERLTGDKDPESTKPVGPSLEEIRKSLPVFKFRQQFLSAIQTNQVLIVVGETGSGKTTQLPQYLHEAGYSKSKDGKNLIVACTQPRRVAAMSVAARVAEEMSVPLGKQVGYNVRFENNTDDSTIIKYLTDGMLLREFLNDPLLSNYGAIMIDEAHERTISTEILLSLLKDIILARTDLKLIIASATINAQKFSDFFNKAPILNIPGRRFPVDIHYTKNPEANYIQAAMTTIFQIHLTQKLPGDILVFLSGQEEIENMETALNESIAKLGSEIQPMIICSIYANLPTELQAKIFEPTPANSRKVVLATNIAETSITIDGIAYVIDPGYVKQNVYNPTTGMESLVVVPCSRASADQRAGRAGRIGPGKCFRLYTKWSFYNELELNPTPEILRVNLVGVILLLLSLGINDLVNFDFMDRPSTETIGKSLELLYALGALNHQGMLTKTGKKMAEFPIDPMFCKCLLVSEKFGVFHSVLSIITMLSEGGNLFYRPKDKREQADKQKEKFIHELGDHFLLLRVWNEWVDSGYSNQWCEDNFIQYKSMKRIRDIRKQLLGLSTRIGIDVNKEDDNDNELTIQKALVSGFFPHVVKLSKMGDSYHKLKLSQPVFIHPSSSIYSTKPPPKLVLYHELVLTSKEFMRNCMIIQDESTVANYGGHYYSKTDLQSITKR
jgi:HrpA-like RNA helicase